MQKTLILWDIDGTILQSQGAGIKSLQKALKDVFGISGSLEGIEFAGRTDPLIIRDIFARFALQPSPMNLSRYVDGYLAVLPKVFSECRTRVLPGVFELLVQASNHPHVVQGLLTGNVRRGAQTKLGHHGLWDYFPIGAFADDSEVRSELGPHALRRAKGHWGQDIPPARVWIVGDTPHDISCAHAFGANALAVATGASKVSDLSLHAPDAVLENLGDADLFWKTLGF